MPQSVILFSEIIPTILAVISIYFIGTGILDDNRPYLTIGLVLFVMAVIVPFAILSVLI